MSRNPYGWAMKVSCFSSHRILSTLDMVWNEHMVGERKMQCSDRDWQGWWAPAIVEIAILPSIQSQLGTVSPHPPPLPFPCAFGFGITIKSPMYFIHLLLLESRTQGRCWFVQKLRPFVHFPTFPESWNMGYHVRLHSKISSKFVLLQIISIFATLFPIYLSAWALTA